LRNPRAIAVLADLRGDLSRRVKRMKPSWKPLALAAMLAVGGLGVLVASSVGEDGGEVGLPLNGSYGSVETISGDELKRVPPERLGLASADAARKSGEAAKIFYFITVNFETVGPLGSGTDAQLFEIRCPKKKQQPVTGGVFAPQPGLSVTNSSRSNPIGPTLAGAWYQGVFNATSIAIQWKPFLTCLGK
jgi:hypothetical protein